MAIKTHLADSAEPLKEGTTIKAKCETLVPSAAFVKQSEDSFRWTVLDAVTHLGNLCSRCRKRMGEMKEKYNYAIISGEEAKQAEAN